MKRSFQWYVLLYALTLFAANASLSAKNMIFMTIKPLPSAGQNVSLETLIQQTERHGQTTFTMLKETLSKYPQGGLFATYYGYTNLSDFNGQIAFPRKTQKDMVQILVTPMIQPIMMIEATVHHWETVASQPARCYSMERKQDDTTHVYYWETKEVEVPKNKPISLETIVLFDDPQDIVVPLGITLSTKSPHLILPTIYTRNNSNIVNQALRVLTIKHFFSQVPDEIKKQNDTHYIQQW